MGARACSRGRAAAARQKSASHACSPRDGRASLRHDQDAHGRDAFSDEDAAARRQRDGTLRARLQSDARDEYRRYQAADGGDCGVALGALQRLSEVITKLRTLRPCMRTASERVSAKIAQIGRAAIQLPGRVRSKTQLQRYHTTKTQSGPGCRTPVALQTRAAIFRTSPPQSRRSRQVLAVTPPTIT